MVKRLTRREASEYLTERGFRISANPLEKKASLREGPTYAIFGNRALYTADDLDSWAEGRLKVRRPTVGRGTDAVAS